MVALAFDTLEASKTLRGAGVDERMAEAIVQVVQRTTETPDISHLATKEDLAGLATKAELAVLATKDEVAAVREEVAAIRLEMAELKGDGRRMKAELSAELSEKLRGHTFALLAYMTALVGAAVALIKLVH